ncbi:MAG: hypothetical protein E7530_02835 [Ruminococcaceae bacterium]|nr:hypothetical protein [Oscillospiraceae bacterium]
MKKTISTILCISLLASIICIPVSATEEVVISESIEEFCEDVNEMVTEYSDSEFVTPEFIDEQPSEDADENIEINYCPRLIVQSDKPIDTYNAIDVVSGFFNFYILQFENEKDTNCAYEQYKNNPDIISVEYDISYDAVLGTTSSETVENKEFTYEDYKNGWYLEATGMDLVLEKYKNQNLPKVIVAVVDTGVDLNCKYLQDILIPTGFNNAGDGDENSEQDYDGHGTMVSSVIANCTTDNVKISNYRCIKKGGKIESLVLACSAILQAVNDGADVINCSFIAPGEFDLVRETVKYAYSQNVAVVVGAGNLPNNLSLTSANALNSSEFTITVGAYNKLGVPSAFTAYGEPVDILAPGENIPVLSLNDTVVLSSGTSFSSPIVTSIYAMFYATHQIASFAERFRAVEGCGSAISTKYVSGYFGSGIADSLKLFEINTVEEPRFSLEEGKHIGEINLELFCEDGAEIIYTTDQTYPSLTNGTRYTEPISVVDEEVCIRAVAYKGTKRSSYVYKKFFAVTPGNDNMFTINKDGVITEYKGNAKYLKIPEVINGIKVIDISSYSGFDKAELYGVILPDTMKYLGWTVESYERYTTTDEQIGAFNDNQTLEFIIGNGIKTVGYYGVSFLPQLKEVEFPNCEEIMCSGFYQSGLVGAEFPKVKKIDNEAFYENERLREIYLPECEEMGYGVFDGNNVLRILYSPNINFMDKQQFVDNIFTLDNPGASKRVLSECTRISNIDLPSMETIGSDFFNRSAIKELYLSNVKYIYDLPNTLNINSSHYGDYYLPVTVSLTLPSTLKYCVPATDYKNEFIEYVVYGTASEENYAKQWAEENGIKFINLSQETAIVEDVEPIWDKYSYEPLEFDARGFNRTYQWYGSKDEVQGDSDDKAISGATAKTFDPGEDAKYQYYYCKMTSTDIDGSGNTLSTFTVDSSMCQNRFHLMYAKDDTYIDFTNKYIFTLQQGRMNVLDIVGVPSTTDYYYFPSHGILKQFFYGTGSAFIIYTNGTQQTRYMIVVQGDTNGDSFVDALDVADVEKTVNGNYNLYDEYYLAADLDCDEGLSVSDYQQVVNRALA